MSLNCIFLAQYSINPIFIENQKKTKAIFLQNKICIYFILDINSFILNYDTLLVRIGKVIDIHDLRI